MPYQINPESDHQNVNAGRPGRFVILLLGGLAVACSGTVSGGRDRSGDDRTPGTGGSKSPNQTPAAPSDMQDPNAPDFPPVTMDPSPDDVKFHFWGSGVDGTHRISAAEYRASLQAIFSDLAPSVDLTGLALPQDEGDTNATGFEGQSRAMTDQELVLYRDAAEVLAGRLLDKPSSLVNGCDLSKKDTACIDKLISLLAPRLYRHTPAQGERDALTGLYTKALEVGADPLTATGAVLTRMLIAPQFLLKVEIGHDASQLGAGMRTLNAFELAARLSFFLWRQGPDDELLNAARDGALLGDAELERQARRLLSDKRAAAVIGQFHAQWLDLRRLADATKTDKRWSEELKADMLEETRRFVEHIVYEGNGSLEDLMTARYSFATPRLGAVYGLPNAGGFTEPTPFAAQQIRGGIFGHASFLAGHATDKESHPIFRAVTLYERVLCRELPKVPPNVAEMEVEDRLAHPVCGGCHRTFEPLGLGLERYGALGEDRSAGKPVIKGEISDALEINGQFDDAAALGSLLVKGIDGPYCYARQWFRFAMGRLEGDIDVSSIDQVVDTFQKKDLNVKELLIALVKTRSFRTRHDPTQSNALCE